MIRCDAILLDRCFLLFTLHSLAQNLEIYGPPRSTQSGYSDLFSGVNLLGKPHVSGVTVFYPWNVVDTSTSGPCTEATCNWSAVDGELLAYIQGQTGLNNGLASHNQKLNLVIEMVPEAGSGPGTATAVPIYVYRPATYSNWCPLCTGLEQDMVSCPSAWPGDAGAPTCLGGQAGSTQQCGGPNGIGTPQAGIWNYNKCHITGQPGNSCGPSATHADISGLPVVYELPVVTAYELFVDAVIKHYSPTGGRYDIGKYIGYIRVGLLAGGESLPLCTAANVGTPPSSVGVWPSYEGLTYDLNNGISPDWYASKPICSAGDAGCRGKFAYIAGDASSQHVGPGYVATIFPAFIASRNHYKTTAPNPYNPSIMANAHSGPPTNNPDNSYADLEAGIFMAAPIGAGFGEQSLSEYDLDTSHPCMDDWCALFNTYKNQGGNLYLQTQTPNAFITAALTQVNQANQKVTCSNPCTGTFSGSNFPGVRSQDGFALNAGSPPKQTYLVEQGGIIDTMNFYCDPSTICPDKPNGGTLYVGDYIPDTIPFASNNNANTIEVYFCDWEYAYNNIGSGALGCQNQISPTLANAYTGVLSNP